MSFPLAPSPLRNGEDPLNGITPWSTVVSGKYPAYPGQTQLGPSAYPTKYPVVGEARVGSEINLLSSGRTPLVVAVHVESVSAALAAAPNGMTIPRGTLVVVAQKQSYADTNKMMLLDPKAPAREDIRNTGYYGIAASEIRLNNPVNAGDDIFTECVTSISVANVDMMQVSINDRLGGTTTGPDNAAIVPQFTATVLTAPMGPEGSKSAQVYFSFQPCYFTSSPPALLHEKPIANAMVDVAPGKPDANYVDIAASCAQLGALAATRMNGGAVPLGPHASTDKNLTHGFCRITDSHIEAEPNSLAAALLYSHGNTTAKDEVQIKLRHELVVNKTIPEAAASAVNKHTGKPLTKYMAHPGIFDCEGKYGQNPNIWKSPSEGEAFAKKYADIVRYAFSSRKAFDASQCHDLVDHLATPVQ